MWTPKRDRLAGLGYEAARDDEESGLGRDINLSDLFEEILIDPLEHELLCVLGTDVVVHQQVRKR
jgi:hypothetical protein